MNKILIIEDDKNISDLVALNLNDQGYQTQQEFDGQQGLLKAINNAYDVILLDLRLPGMDGFQICQQLRMQKIKTPVIMLTSKSEEIDRVLGLEIGADDYITKPFSVRELVARVKAMLRRAELYKQPSEEEENKEIRYENIYINENKRIVEVYSKRIELSPKEFDLLLLLASNPGRTYTRMQLLNQVWGYEFEGFEHTVNSHINRLRSKLEKNMNEPEFILTTWGVGYKFREE